MTRATILEGNIDDDFWPELVLTMTYIKNSRITKALPQNLSPYKALTRDRPNISHLRILGSIIYIFLHEEEQTLKSEKWATRALKGTLVGYNGHTIYRVHIKEQNKVIRVKDLRIFENYKSKSATNLPDYDNGMPTIQGFILDDNDDDKEESLQNSEEGRGSTLRRRSIPLLLAVKAERLELLSIFRQQAPNLDQAAKSNHKQKPKKPWPSRIISLPQSEARRLRILLPI